MRASSVLAAAVVVILALAGCGGSSSAPRHHHVQLTAFEQKGKAIFIRKCGTCHTLADAGTGGIAGPDLDSPWSASRVQETIADGPSLMPAGVVTGQAAAEVAAYVAAATK